MDHNTCRENLSAYLDGELPPQERAALETHLAGCPDCAKVLAELRSVSGIFKKNVMEPVPLSLKGEVLGGRRKPAAYPWFGPVLAFSTVAAGVLIVLNLHKIPGQDQSFQQTSSGLASTMAGSRERASLMQPSGNTAFEAKEEAMNAAPARPAEDAGLYAESEMKKQVSPAVAAVRGSYGQAKYARPMGFASGGSGGGGTSGSLSGSAGEGLISNAAPAAGYKAPAAPKAELAKRSAAKTGGAAEFRGPVCVYVSSARSREETFKGMGAEESDDFSWYLGKALIFLEKSGTPSPSAEPGRLVFVKKDGSRKTVTEKDCDLGFIFFDGVQDPLVVTDFVSITEQYNKYFGTSLQPIGDDIPD